MNVPPRPDPPERDPALDAAWRARSTELPPPRLDAAILAAAHREARSRPRAAGDDDTGSRARGPSRAWWGLAAAATIGAIAFGIVQIAPQPATEAPVVASDTPSVAQQQPPTPEPLAERKVETTAAQDQAAMPAAPPAAKPARPAPKASVGKRAEVPFPGAMPAQPTAPPAEPVTTHEAETRAERADDGQLTRQRSATALRSDARNASGAVAALGSVERAPRTPDAWIEAIREFYTAQRLADAARELNAFRAAYADADSRLPPELAAWARSIPRE